MKLISYKVDPMEKWSSRPQLEITVDKIPDISELRYECRDFCYFAEKDGYVSFYYYEAPGQGFGGNIFNLTLVDGTQVALKGPWSSRSSVMNKMGFPESMEVTILEENGSRRARFAGHASITWLRANGIPLVPVYHGYTLEKYEPGFEVVNEDGIPYKPWETGKGCYSRPRGEIDLIETPQ